MPRGTPPEWVEEAKFLRRLGYSYRAVGRQLGLSYNAVAYQLDPAYRERTRQKWSAWAEKNPERAKSNSKRSSTRNGARQEAAATGEPLEAVYARWGVTSRKPGVWP